MNKEISNEEQKEIEYELSRFYGDKYKGVNWIKLTEEDLDDNC